MYLISFFASQCKDRASKGGRHNECGSLQNSTGFIKVPLNLRGSRLKEAGANLNIDFKLLLWWGNWSALWKV